MAVSIIMWSAAGIMVALAAFLVFLVVFLVSAGISGIREAQRQQREKAAARDLIVRAFTGPKGKSRG